MKRERGITLIALVITIIVLLILAGVSISLVLGNNGVLTQSKTSVTENKKATAKEEVTMAWAACETDYWNAWEKDSSVSKQDFFEGNNGNPGLSSYLTTGTVTNFLYGDNTTFDYEKSASEKYHITINNKGEVSSIEKTGISTSDVETGGGNEVATTELWTQNGTTVINSTTNQTLEVGDIVSYDCGVTSYPGQWAVLGSEDGQLLLISTIKVATVNLSGKQDYITDSGTTKLNNACARFKNETYATKIRSVKVEDINRVTGYIEPEPITYTYTMSNGHVKRNDSEPNEWETSLEDVYGNQLSEDNPVSIEANYYRYQLSDKIESGGKAYNLLLGSQSYWLDSKYANSSPWSVSYGFRMGAVAGDNYPLYMSNSGGYECSYGFDVRAVVYLNSDVQLSGSSSTSWSIQLPGQSVENPQSSNEEIGEVSDIQTTGPWVQDGTTITNSATNQTLEIGDKIYYNSGVTAYEGSGSTQGKWGVFGVENGNLLLLSTELVQDNFELSGKQGYLTGVTQLNNICASYKNETYATESRSITMEDMSRILGGNSGTISWDTYRLVDGKVKKDGFTYSSYSTSFEDINGNVLNANNSIDVTQKYPYLINRLEDMDNEKVIKFLGGEGYYEEPFYDYELDYTMGGYYWWFNPINYWLASPFVITSSTEAYWGLKSFQDGCDLNTTLWNSNSGAYSRSSGVRAVVCLKSDVVLSGSNSNGWNISLSE